jgi:hypothetical protein
VHLDTFSHYKINRLDDDQTENATDMNSCPLDYWPFVRETPKMTV